MQVAVISLKPPAVWVDKPGWVVDGFAAAGHDVFRCHALAEVQAADEEADLLVFDQKAAGLQHVSLAKLARSHRAIWADWYRDLIQYYRDQPLERQPIIQNHLRQMRSMDIVFVKEHSLLHDLGELGVNAQRLDQACPVDMPACTHSDNPEWDVLVFGCTSSYRQRYDDARALVSAGFRVLWLNASGDLPPGVKGAPWKHPFQLPEIASRCGVVLGVDFRCDVPGYTSDRTYLAAGMGACYVARVGDFGDQTTSHAPQAAVAAWTYSATDELIGIVRQALADPAERRRRGEASRALVMTNHTYKQRAEQIVAAVEGLKQAAA